MKTKKTRKDYKGLVISKGDTVKYKIYTRQKVYVEPGVRLNTYTRKKSVHIGVIKFLFKDVAVIEPEKGGDTTYVALRNVKRWEPEDRL